MNRSQTARRVIDDTHEATVANDSSSISKRPNKSTEENLDKETRQREPFRRNAQVKELKHQRYDCMLEVEDNDDTETVATEENLLSTRPSTSDVDERSTSSAKRGPNRGNRNIADIEEISVLQETAKLKGYDEFIEDPSFASATTSDDDKSHARRRALNQSTLSSSTVGSTAAIKSDKYQLYSAANYDHLEVSDEIHALFQSIDQYQPRQVELDTILKPFIPSYIPAVGRVDEFLKIPRPDGKEDGLGISMVDEPALHQTDLAVLELQLQMHSKKKRAVGAIGGRSVMVRSIEDASFSSNKLQIENWVQRIEDLHKSKPPAQVYYKKNMPSLEELVEPWPEEFDSALRNETVVLPDVNLDMDLIECVKLLCSILDIPVFEGGVIESVHLMFLLFMEFKANPVSDEGCGA